MTEDFAPSLEAPIFAISRRYPWYPIGMEPNTKTWRKSSRDFGIRDRRRVPVYGTTLALPSQFDTILAIESDLHDEDLEHPLDATLL